mmetsp:Transcript_114790/g.335686  ORF Transcript_114790/g.335686 Transcript_114790/m.335686 type:complete len:334 (-) Transcript_114790:94-1095(-)
MSGSTASDGEESVDSTTVNVAGWHKRSCPGSQGPQQGFTDGNEILDSLEGDGIKDIPGILKVNKLIGKGEFSAVYSCSMETLGNVAVKKFSLGVSLRSVMDVLQGLRHPNIVEVLKVNQSVPISIVLELCGPDLHQVLHGTAGADYPGVAHPEERLHAASGIVDAVAYLHEHEILHRDISSRSCLAALRPGPSSPALHFKLGEFTLARGVAASAMTQWTGSFAYMAPEVMEENNYGYPCDVFSVGILLHETACRVPPYHGKCTPRLAIMVLSGLRPSDEDVPAFPGRSDHRREELLAILAGCWVGEPEARVSAAEAGEALRGLLLPGGARRGS